MSKSNNKKHKGSKYFGNSQRRAHNAPQRNTPTLSSHKGSLQITRSGMGFVILDKSEEGGDVLVRPQDFNTAMNGDKVIVDIKKQNQQTGKREGKIARVLQRKQSEFIGTIEISPKFAFFIPDGNKGLPDFYVPLSSIKDAKHQDKVIVKLVKWPENEKKPIGEVISVISQEDLNDIAMKSLLMENGFPVQFDDEVLAEANKFSDKITTAELKKRKDFRKVTTFTIDPNDSKDFDDAISFKKLRGGSFEIGVHIADVSHFVQPGTKLDEEAYKRATSVYLPDRVDPMLPERISNFLCSLRPHEDKYTFSAVFNIDSNGKISKTWIGRTVIHSDKRFTYDDVQAIILGGDGDFKDEVLTINTISQALRAERFKHGAINFSSQEVRFKLDEKGLPIGIEVNESNESHQLIEELMLLANKAVAELAQKTKVKKEPIPFPYRIHDQPDELKLTPFIALAKKFGYQFDTSNPEKIAQSFNAMLTSLEGKPESTMLQQLGIRTMAKAAYSPQNIGHYGLGFKDYCHFTSPIRRYPDVMVHRVIEEILEGKKNVDEKMEIKCKHCSERERASLECERAANKYKQVEYMQQFLGEKLEGIISGVSAFGFWVETLEAKCEGLVSIKDLANFDDFNLIEEDYALVGLRSGRKFRMGDHVWIRVVATNLEKRQIDFEWLPNANIQTETKVVAIENILPKEHKVAPTINNATKTKPKPTFDPKKKPTIKTESKKLVSDNTAKATSLPKKPVQKVSVKNIPIEKAVTKAVEKSTVANKTEKKKAPTKISKEKKTPIIDTVSASTSKKTIIKSKKSSENKEIIAPASKEALAQKSVTKAPIKKAKIEQTTKKVVKSLPINSKKVVKKATPEKEKAITKAVKIKETKSTPQTKKAEKQKSADKKVVAKAPAPKKEASKKTPTTTKKLSSTAAPIAKVLKTKETKSTSQIKIAEKKTSPAKKVVDKTNKKIATPKTEVASNKTNKTVKTKAGKKI
ncbi:ribonuclease R [Rhizosphaericola mali]|uniref:Ribonuclease R n=1 Tax=Rhizosphaericola mali TaxID=2545455 RepID=A0A5P2G7G9_9BACT|nr:ribonuclease R [Rhizosphaericola mali]QES87461.1 ribonuclease R [Rhizosphaericola mali]